MVPRERRLVCTGKQPLNKSKPLGKPDAKPLVTTAHKSPAPTPQTLLSKKQLACSECGDRFADYRSLHQHQQASPSHRVVYGRHNGDRSACRDCSVIIELPAHLEQHYLARHPVVSLGKDDPRRAKQFKAYFLSKWTHPGPKGAIIDILSVHNPGHRTKRFEDYRVKLKQSGAKLKEPLQHSSVEF